MSGRLVHTPISGHQCFFLFPTEAGLFAVVGTRWQCDECNSIWELVRGEGWVLQ